MNKENLPELPPTKDKKFWGEDAQSEQVRLADLVPETSGHYLEWIGGVAMCTSCPHLHTVALDRHKYRLVDGAPKKISVPVDNAQRTLL